MIITYSDILEILADGNIGRAIEYTLKLANQIPNGDYVNDCIGLSVRNKTNERSLSRGTLERSNYNTELARLTHSLQSVLKDMKKDYPNLSVEVEGNSTTSPTSNTSNNSTKGKEPETPPKQKILFLAANPSDAAGLQTDKEHRLIKAELERGKARDLYEFLHPQLSLTVGELLRALEACPDIIHFSGHGTKDGIVIVNDDNTHSIIPTEALEYLFESAQEYVKIVVLNACHSAAHAEVISKFGIYVIGNNLEIGDEAAINFARTFYLALGEGNSLQKAYKSAKFALMVQNPKFVKVVEVWKDGKLLKL